MNVRDLLNTHVVMAGKLCEACTLHVVNSSNPEISNEFKGQIECDLCKVWYEKACAAQHNASLKRAWTEACKAKKSVKIPFWNCPECQNTWDKVNSEKTSTSAEFIALQQAFQSLQVDFNAFQRKMTTAQSNNVEEISQLQNQHILTMQKSIKTLTEEIKVQKDLAEKNNREISDFKKIISDLKKQTSDEIAALRAENQRLTISITALQYPVKTTPMDNSSVKKPNGGTTTRKQVDETRKKQPTTKPVINPQQPPPKEIGINVSSRIKNIIIGDSLLKQTGQVLYNSKTRVFCKPGLTTRKLNEIISNSPICSEVKNFSMHVGTNDLRNKHTFDFDYVLGDMWQLIEIVKIKFPHAVIAMSGILFRSDFRIGQIKRFNDSIKWMCKCLDVKYVEANRSLDTRLDYERDGLHLNTQGIVKFSYFLKNCAFPASMSII